MPTRLQIAKLAQRIEALAPASRAERKVVSIIVDGESEEAVLERHFQAHPEDRGAFIIAYHVVDPKHSA
jgi:hypothetical protein